MAELAGLTENHYILQQELADALQALGRSIHSLERDIIISHCEINADHGVGVLLQRLFPNSDELLTIRSHDLYGGQQEFGDRHFLVQGESFVTIAQQVQWLLHYYAPRRLLSVPYFPEDYQISIALKRLYNCPLCVFIMDDQNIYSPQVPDSLVEELLYRADICLGISRPLCDAYEAKFKRKFWFVPPVVQGHLLQTEPPQSWDRSPSERQGVMIGNVWSQQWLDQLRSLCRATGVKIDWYGNPNRDWLNFTEAELGEDGINFKGFVPEDELINILRTADFALIPTGNSDQSGDRPELTKLSLPSRSCFITATANLPILVVGSPESAVAQFVQSQGIGVVCAYQPEDFSAKIDYLLENQGRIRQQAFKLGKNLSADGIAQWIWDSLAQGQAMDARFEVQQKPAKIIDASVVITPNEVTYRHGTGALIKRVFPNDGQIVSVRSDNHYGGDHNFGLESYHLSQRGWSRKQVFTNIAQIFADHEVSRIFCVPYYREDVLTAIAIKELFGVPLAVWIMDDQNVRVNNVPDALMEEFLQKADVRFATHPELRDAYENKFGLKFWILPAVVPHGLIKTEIFQPTSDNCEQKRGALLGSIWSEKWFADLCCSTKEAGVQLDWYGNSKYYWLTECNEDLRAKGIYPQGLFPEDKLVEKLKEYPFIVVPTGTMDERDDQPQLSQLSLPGRILFALATSNTPVILMGSAKTSAASFINRFQIGVVCDYTPESFGAAVAEVLDPQRQRVLRENAVAVAEKFGDQNIDSWIWDSLAEGQAADDRFESLFRRSPIDLVHFIEPPVPSLIYKDYAQVYQVMRRLKVNNYRPDFVMDVGASHGIWSHTASQLFPEARFILIDPLINRYEQAARNYYLKNIPKAKFLEIAVSDESGQLSFQVSPDLYGSSLLTPADFRDYETVTVAVKTLDQVAEEENLQGRGILKLDVQCAEHIVLAGANTFLEQVDLVVAELSYVRYDENALVFLEMLNLLEQLGFRYYDETGEWRSPIDGTLLQKEVVFIRQDLLVPETSRKI
ncbi:FkbM family methyltransferase [Synechocystis sp. FACHB-383]|uniref:FkbM family methyltransferase n=1 Tax=Synechocystis sp. FACHB-383 TaxID=2692864 RepID=UPI001684C552|nr:FkbM family methyltransferase [Synechocystis sp. FACHB-383]MBD2653560.1 FkbM family methyltransferase [Synechocystis sp. FACHB-383]